MLSSPFSPPLSTWPRIHRNGSGPPRPRSTTRTTPACSTTYSRPLPSGATAMCTGSRKPCATCCSVTFGKPASAGGSTQGMAACAADAPSNAANRLAQTRCREGETLRTHHVGDLVVVEEKAGQRIPVGILTDRDLVIEILAKDVDMNAVTVGDVMSGELLTARASDGLYETLQRMRAKGVRRVPVVNAGGGGGGRVGVGGRARSVGRA